MDLVPTAPLEFGVSAQFWLNLRQQHDLIQAHIAAGDQIDRIEPVAA